MKRRLGSHPGGAVSFFAFQDIITATVGFLLLMTLFLALTVAEIIPRESPAPDQTPVASREEDLRTMQTAIKTLQQEVADLQNRPAEDETTVRRMIGQLKTTIAGLQKKPLPGLDRNNDATAMEEQLRRDKNKLLADLEKLHGTVQEAEKMAAGTVADIPDLQKKIQEAETSLKTLRDRKNVLVLVPENADTSKQPVLVLVQGSRIQVQRADAPPTSVGSLPEFVEYLRRLSAATHYVVLYFKPSGAHHFEPMTNLARQEGFEIGYDVVPEDMELEFRNP